MSSKLYGFIINNINADIAKLLYTSLFLYNSSAININIAIIHALFTDDVQPVNNINKINKSEEDVERLYSDWKIEGYSPNEIVIYKEYDGICGDHYIVKEHNGVIGIYKLDSVGNEIFVEDTELQIQYLPEIDIIKLKEGITALGQAELNSVLEDFE